MSVLSKMVMCEQVLLLILTLVENIELYSKQKSHSIIANVLLFNDHNWYLLHEITCNLFHILGQMKKFSK